jgi:hypothetical protein
MIQPTYPISSIGDRLSYEFFSEGPKGSIKKVVQYREFQPNIFNIAFGDWNETLQQIDDDSRSNNQDRDKVLKTVASTVLIFIRYHPDASMYLEGSTPSRTRLYQMGIANNFKEINELFNVNGFHKEAWEPFTTCKNYDAFFLSTK